MLISFQKSGNHKIVLQIVNVMKEIIKAVTQMEDVFVRQDLQDRNVIPVLLGTTIFHNVQVKSEKLFKRYLYIKKDILYLLIR